MADDGYHYKANATPESEELRKKYGYKWRSPIFMPREAARITLEVKNVRVEKLQDISEMDALAEAVREWLENWIEQSIDDLSPACWFYYDPENRYWCNKHIKSALKQFKRGFRNGEIKIGSLEGLSKKEAMEEIDGYCRDDSVEEERPIYCETCGEPLRFSAMDNLIGEDFDEYLNETWNKHHVPLIYSLLCNHEKEFFSKPNINRLAFRAIWDALNGKRGYSWQSNPWVWVYEFGRVERV
jgi:hypothetical protein